MDLFKKNPLVKSLSAATSRSWLQVALLAIVAVAYWLAVRLGLLVVARPEGVASIWPASGLALAVLLLSPKRRWSQFLTVIFVTNALGNLAGGNSLLVSLGFALANALEALLAAWVLTFLCKTKVTFGRVVEISALFGVVILCNGLTALLGAGVSALAFGASFENAWLVWWISDGLGMILVAPLVVTWFTSRSMFQSASSRRIVEAIILIFMMSVFSWLLFGPFTVAEEPLLRNYMLFPFLIWLAFRYSPRGMASALTLFSAIAIWETLHGYGIFGFSNQTATQHLISVQMLLSVLAFTGLLLSALISERKNVVEELRQSEDKFKYVFDHSVIGKSLTLPSGEVNVNQAFCDMLGYSPQELQQRKWQELTHPEDIEITQNAMDALIIGGKDLQRFTKRYIHKNGSIVWTDVGSTLRRDNAGKPLYFITSILDISERKRAETQIQKMNIELEQRVQDRTRELQDTQEKLLRQEKLAVLGQMAGGVGHELRNPLAVISNAVYYLKLVQPDADEKIKRYHGLIESETHIAEKIITDLLDFARSKSLECEPVPVPELVQRVLARFPVPDSIATSLQLPADLPDGFADSRQMEQILGNLVLNACQAMPDGGKLTISAKLEQGLIAVAVNDTGIGILPENLSKLFEPLFTTKAKGIGLGLAVSRKLAEANGGRIEVASQSGKGSTFTLFFPVFVEGNIVQKKSSPVGDAPSTHGGDL